MRIFLLLLSIVTLVIGVNYFITAKTVFDQSEGWMILLIATILFVGSAIVEAVAFVSKEIKTLRESIDNVTILPDDE